MSSPRNPLLKLVFSILFVFISCPIPTQGAATPPRIVFILVDDLRYDTAIIGKW